ncbi:MAG: class I SAM-dependent methyltransferase [Candidatus Hodarchaeales archaeon]
MWVDAGCGQGTYTLALAGMVSKVIAIDKNRLDITYLKNHPLLPENVEVSFSDFNWEKFYEEWVDGVLFAFSLHYQPDREIPLKNAYEQIVNNGQVIIVDYTRISPVPWIPYPLPKERLLKLLTYIGFKNIEQVFQNRRFYIVKGFK